MTRAEAKDILYEWQEMMVRNGVPLDTSKVQALRVAIEALSDRPHGEWVETSDGTMCGNCHEFPYDDGEYHIANWHSDFCPNCGADMRKEKE